MSIFSKIKSAFSIEPKGFTPTKAWVPQSAPEEVVDAAQEFFASLAKKSAEANKLRLRHHENSSQLLEEDLGILMAEEQRITDMVNELTKDLASIRHTIRSLELAKIQIDTEVNEFATVKYLNPNPKLLAKLPPQVEVVEEGSDDILEGRTDALTDDEIEHAMSGGRV